MGLVAVAVGYQWFYNGANFQAFKVAGNNLHPLMVATLRFSIAALILLPLALTRWRRASVSFQEPCGEALIGVTMLANTFNYAAPVVALCLSALLLREPLTLVKLVSGGIALMGVALMIDRKALDGEPTAATEEGRTASRLR